MDYRMQAKKEAQDETSVTLVHDPRGASMPKHFGFEKVVLTFAATPKELFGTQADDKTSYVVTIQRMT